MLIDLFIKKVVLLDIVVIELIYLTKKIGNFLRQLILRKVAAAIS